MFSGIFIALSIGYSILDTYLEYFLLRCYVGSTTKKKQFFEPEWMKFDIVRFVSICSS